MNSYLRHALEGFVYPIIGYVIVELAKYIQLNPAPGVDPLIQSVVVSALMALAVYVRRYGQNPDNPDGKAPAN